MKSGVSWLLCILLRGIDDFCRCRCEFGANQFIDMVNQSANTAMTCSRYGQGDGYLYGLNIDTRQINAGIVSDLAKYDLLT